MSNVILKRPRREIAVVKKDGRICEIYFTQKAAAEALHVSRSLISLILHGHVKTSRVLAEYDIGYADDLCPKSEEDIR